MKILLLMIIYFIFIQIVYAFPNHISSPIFNDTNEKQTIIEGCIGNCASCHSLSKEEAKKILSKKFDIKKISKILVKRGYFQIFYKDSKDREKLLNLLFSKDKVAPVIIELKENQ